MSFPSETSSAFQFGIGDEYVLIDIALPQSYIDEAEKVVGIWNKISSAELSTKGAILIDT